jgi:hypothetical protein
MDVGMIQHSHLELELVILGRMCTDVPYLSCSLSSSPSSSSVAAAAAAAATKLPRAMPTLIPSRLAFTPNPLFISLRVQHDQLTQTDGPIESQARERTSERANE